MSLSPENVEECREHNVCYMPVCKWLASDQTGIFQKEDFPGYQAKYKIQPVVIPQQFFELVLNVSSFPALLL